MRGMAMNADRMMTSFKPVTNEWLGHHLRVME